VDSIALVGNVNVDVVVQGTTTVPPPGAEWLLDTIDLRTGGAAANAALALSGLGCSPLLVGCIGDDTSGAFLRNALLETKIQAFLTTIGDAPTGVSVAIEAPDRDRSFLTSLGALASFDASMIPPMARRSRFVLVCGYFLLPKLRGKQSRQLFEAVRKSGGTTLLDCGWDPDGWTNGTVGEIYDLLELTHVFLPNEVEATALTGEREPEAAGRALHSLFRGTVVVKLGAEGCLAITSRGDLHRFDAPRVETNDTTGAGDAFNAGLLSALARGLEWSESLPIATKVASTVVGNASRARYAMPEDLTCRIDRAADGP
jgi:sugar/nucleoside kinase (ribokinase family)